MINNFKLSKSQITSANNIDLIQFAKLNGYILENGGRRAFHAKQSGGLYFFKDNNKYYHFSTDTRGGPIDFVMQFWNLSFKEAVVLLLNSKSPQWTLIPTIANKDTRKLILPDRASNHRRVTSYLVHIRGIDPEIIFYLMHEKKLYQQDKTGNCIFVAYDHDGTAKYCSMRGSTPERHFKQDMENSDKSYPFHIPCNGRRVYVCESSIDAMSHATLSKLSGLDWQTDHRISLGCLSDKALERFLSQQSIQEIIFCLDNDHNATFRNGSPAPNWGQEAAIKFTQKYAELGYQTSIQTPKRKDFNEDLIAFLEAEREAKLPPIEEECEHEH